MSTIDAPVLKHTPIEDVNTTQIADYIQKLGNVGAIKPDQPLEEWLRQQIDAPDIDEESREETEEPEEVMPTEEPTEGEDGPASGGNADVDRIVEEEGVDRETAATLVRIREGAFALPPRSTTRKRIRQLTNKPKRRNIQLGAKRLDELGKRQAAQSASKVRRITDQEWEDAQEEDRLVSILKDLLNG